MGIAATIHSTQPILLVEDNPEDYEATLRAFKMAQVRNPIMRCEDGDDALDYLYRRGKYADSDKAPRPSIILLDLNLPGTDGYEVLAELKRDPTLKRIPVLVLTSSAREDDVDACYAAGANSYIQKSADMKRFVEAIERLNKYWFEIAIIPKQGDVVDGG